MFTDITENENGFELQLDVPGIKREALEVQVEKDKLVVKGERQQPHRIYNRVFVLPDFVNREGIEAKLVDGVLNLKLPRREEAKPKQIAVQVN